MSDEKLAVSTAQLSKLAEVRTEPKYGDEPGTLYNGLRPASARQKAEAQLNDLIDRLCTGLASTPTKQFVLCGPRTLVPPSERAKFGVMANRSETGIGTSDRVIVHDSTSD